MTIIYIICQDFVSMEEKKKKEEISILRTASASSLHLKGPKSKQTYARTYLGFQMAKPLVAF